MRKYKFKKVAVLSCIFGAILIGMGVRELKLYQEGKAILEATVAWSEKCLIDEKDTVCMALRATHRNLEEVVDKLIWPMDSLLINSYDYKRLENELWPKVDVGLSYADKQMAKLTQEIDELHVFGQELDKAKKRVREADLAIERGYDELAAPKILYRCDGQLAFIASKSNLNNINSLLYEIKVKCPDNSLEIVRRAG
ncbi:hypothetical protein [Pseudomonas fulva]|uniref:hypothetical protein n=1 Tax=Pseudomonas fulva TaxID=47880 RepID=UPI00191D6FC2|nr:hypothetical protein [Pseudomonas fulva]MBN4166149.1 hypothetical protein [Pseudomonas fulva]